MGNPTTVSAKAEKARAALQAIKADPEAAIAAFGDETEGHVERLKAVVAEGKQMSAILPSEAKASGRASRDAAMLSMGMPAAPDAEGDEFRAAMDPNRTRRLGYEEKNADGTPKPVRRVPAPYSENPEDFETSYVPDSLPFFGSPRAAYEEPTQDAVRATIAKYLPPEELIGLGPDHPTYKRAANFMWERERKKAVAAGQPISRLDYDPRLASAPSDPEASLVDKGLSALGNAGRSMVKGAAKIGNAGLAGASSLLGGLSLGAVPRALGMLPTAAYDSEAIADAQATHPYASAAGTLTGVMSGKGLPGQVFGAAGAGVTEGAALAGRALPAAGAVMKGSHVLTGMATGAVGGAVGSGAVGVLEDASHGEWNPSAAPVRMGLGAALGAPLEALGMAAGAGERWFKRQPLGQSVEQFERSGGAVGPTGWNLKKPPALQELEARGVQGRNINATEQAFEEGGERLATGAYDHTNAKLGKLSEEAHSYYVSKEGMEVKPLSHTANTTLDAVLAMKGRPFANPGALEDAVPKLWNMQLMTDLEASAYVGRPGYRTFGADEVAEIGVNRAFRGAESSPAAKAAVSESGEAADLVYVMTPRKFTARGANEIEPDVNRLAKAWKEDTNVPREHSDILHSMFRDRSQWKSSPSTPERPVVITNDRGEQETLTGYAAMKKRHQSVIDEAGDTLENAGLPRESPGTRPWEVKDGEVNPREIRLDPQQRERFKTTYRGYQTRGEGNSTSRDAALAQIAEGTPGAAEGLRMVQASNAHAAASSASGLPGAAVNTGGGGNVRSAISKRVLGTALYPLMRSMARSEYGYRAPVPGPYQAQPTFITGNSLALRGSPSHLPIAAEEANRKRR